MPKSKKNDFEASLSRLEKIVGELESEDLKLEESLLKFEEGISLVRGCSKKLDEAEKRIEILIKDKDGKLSARPFGGSSDATN